MKKESSNLIVKPADSQKFIEFCKYYDPHFGKCPYRTEFLKKLSELEEKGEDPGALQPRCPKDAQRNKRGVLCCYLERRDKLC